MAPSTPLSIATAAIQRLVKEEASYHQEQQDQEKRIEKLEAQEKTGDSTEDENREYTLRQERQALEQTKAVFPALKQKISDAVKKAENLLVEEGKKGEQSDVEQINAAKEAISQSKTATREIS
ncbi:hypothetical protein FQN54_000842 [Arachnomyces sp. PD_36]|nr:hypothetical protein FQN54_000842 [Arachnomyces sp. PD_36]